MDLTPIAAAAASLASSTVTAPGPASLPPADGAAAARFSEVMRGGSPLAPDDPAGPFVPGTGPSDLGPRSTPSSGSTPLNIGESILSTLQNASEGMRQAHVKIQSLLEAQGEPMTVRQGLALQFQLSVTTLQYDLIGKVVSKSIQNVDQMVKMQ